MSKRNANINNNINPKKEKPSYAKMFKEQMKKEHEMTSNKSHISNNKNASKIENNINKEEKKEVKHNAGINFDNLSDWDNIVYPADNEIKNMISQKEENNNNIQNGIINNENNININNNIIQNEFQNNIINQIKEENDNSSEKEQLEQIEHNMNNVNNLYNNLNPGLKPTNPLNEFSVNTSEFTNKNEILNQYDNISLGTYNLDNNINNLGKKIPNQNLFNDNYISQIKPLDFGGGLNDINNVIKEEDSLENEDKNMCENKDKENINDNKDKDNYNNKNDINIEFDDVKAQRDIMEQMEDEMNLSMNQMNELAGNYKGNQNIKGNNFKNKNKVQKNSDKNNKRNLDIKNNNSKKVENKMINNKTSKNNNKNDIKNNLNSKSNTNIARNSMNNNNIMYKNSNDNNKNNEVPLNNLNNNIIEQNNNFNQNNFSFKPTNIQQISAEEVNAFIQKNQQQNINNFNQPQLESNPKIITPIQPTLNQPQINANINPNINININPNIPIQTNMPPPMYPSPYPIIIPQNQNPQMMYGIPYGMYPPSGYQFPVQNQFGGYPNPQMEQKIDVKTEKKKVNYKPKSLKEYKQKYNNGTKEHRGGLGANIGGEEWEHKKEQNLKVKKYSEMIKNQNKDKENHFKNKFKIKNELNEQLYDSLSDEVIEDEPKEKDKDKNKDTNNNKENKNKEENKENKENKRPESNKVKYLMQLKKEKEKENKGKDNKLKYSKYKKIVIESIDKKPETNEKKMGKIYTTYKPPMQRNPSSKGKRQLVKQNNINNNKLRSQSTGLKTHMYKANNNYDDELTKKFMSPSPNDYNGYANNKDQNGNFMSPTFEIENLLQKKEQYDSKIREIKNFLKI